MFELCIDVCNNVNDVHDFVNPLPKRKALRSPCSPPMSGFGCYDSAINPSCKVWFTNISEAGDQETFCSLVERIKEIDEKKRITKFVFPADQKRAYFSGVLQRAMIRDHLEVGDGEFTVCRPAQVCLLSSTNCYSFLSAVVALHNMIVTNLLEQTVCSFSQEAYWRLELQCVSPRGLRMYCFSPLAVGTH